jgi:hypothetical protein
MTSSIPAKPATKAGAESPKKLVFTPVSVGTYKYPVEKRLEELREA